MLFRYLAILLVIYLSLFIPAQIVLAGSKVFDKPEKTTASQISDKAILKQLEQKLGKTLKQYNTLDEMMMNINEVSGYVLNNKQQIVGLQLESCGLTDVPNQLFLLRNITHLNLSDNKITILPEQISKLQALTHFKLTSNPLKKLPAIA